MQEEAYQNQYCVPEWGEGAGEETEVNEEGERLRGTEMQGLLALEDRSDFHKRGKGHSSHAKRMPILAKRKDDVSRHRWKCDVNRQEGNKTDQFRCVRKKKKGEGKEIYDARGGGIVVSRGAKRHLSRMERNCKPVRRSAKGLLRVEGH